MAKSKGVSGRAVRIVALVLLGVLLALSICFFVMENGALPVSGTGAMHFEAAGITMRYDMDSYAQIHTYKEGKGFFLASRDGVRFVGSDGLEKMSDTFNMSAPRLIGKAGVIGVAEENGATLYVYNASGRMYAAQTENPIVSFSVAPNGYSVVITRKGEDYNVIVYTDMGKISFNWIYVEPNVYPLAAEVSNDGRILAISYLNTNGGEMNSRIEFVYINKTEAADYVQTDSVYAADNANPDRLVGVLRFMEGNKLLALSDKGIVCYDADNKARRSWSMELGNVLDAYCFAEPGWFALAYGERDPNLPGEEPGLCRFYDLSGTVLGDYRAPAGATALFAGYNSVLIGSGRQFTALSNNGNFLWSYDATMDVSQALFMENTNKLVLAGGAQAEVVRRVRDKADDAAE